MNKETKQNLANHFAVLREKQTWLNLAYLLLAFPLGIAYFVISVTGLSLGVGLMIIWVGFFILLALFAGWWGMAMFERQLAIHMLGAKIPPMAAAAGDPDGTLFEKAKSHFTNPVTWKSAFYLLVKFPVGIVSFVVAVTAVSLIGGLVFAPFAYANNTISIFSWQIDSLGEALLATVLGLAAAPYAFIVTNWVAGISARIAETMLGGRENRPIEKTPEDLIKIA